MKQIYFSVAMFFIAAMSFAQTSDLLISRYGEGTSNNKFFEIYNGTGAPVSLDGYAFPSVSNAPNTVGEYEFWNTFTPGAVIADGDVYVVAHPSADATILAAADQTFSFLSNGDDGFALALNDGTFTDANSNGVVDEGERVGYTIVDWLGDFQGDPGSGWDVSGVTNATQNHTLTRKSSICSPNNNWDSSRGYDPTTMATTAAASEWIVTGVDTEWASLGQYTGCSTAAVVSITAPGDGSTLPAGTTTTDVTFSAQNAPMNSTFNITVNGIVTINVTSPFQITVQNGASYTVTVDLLDNATVVATDTSNFDVAFPCDLQIGTITETCQANTSGVDLYDVTIDYTGGGTSTYTIDTAGNGTVGGDDPTTTAAGQITITGVSEGTNFTVTFTGDTSNSACDFTRNITSPSCIGSITCPNVGDIVVTEIMKNPSAVNDSDGEYFEVYNTTSAPIDMQGFEVSDNGTNMFTIATLTVPANGYVVLGVNADVATNGGVNVDYEYTSFTLGNGDDAIIISCQGTVIDQVSYTDADFPDTAGVAMELAVSKLNATDNDLGANWGDATSSINNGNDLGTPGAANDFTLSNDTFEANTFKIYPNPVSHGLVNITSSNGQSVDVVIYSTLGQQVLSRKGLANTLNVNRLDSGMYIVKITQGSATQTRKLVIK